MVPGQLSDTLDRALPAHRAVDLAAHAGRLHLDRLPARDLDAEELRDLVALRLSDDGEQA